MRRENPKTKVVAISTNSAMLLDNTVPSMLFYLLRKSFYRYVFTNKNRQSAGYLLERKCAPRLQTGVKVLMKPVRTGVMSWLETAMIIVFTFNSNKT